MSFANKSVNFLREGFFLHSWWKALVVHLAAAGFVILLFILWFFSLKLPAATNHNVTATVPEITGESLEQAAEILQKYHLRYQVIDSTYNPNFDPGAVVSYVPKSGDTVKENRTIYITIRSHTAPLTPVPKGLVNNRTLTEAVNRLESNSLVVGEIIPRPHQHDHLVLELLVNGRKIESDTMLPIGTKVDIVFGVIDESPTIMPNLKGRTMNDAKKILPGLSLYPVAIYDPEALELPGTIIRQQPKAGDTIPKGSEVDLWIAGSEAMQPK